MTFAYPHFLWLLLLLPPLWVWWYYHRRPALRFSDLRLVRGLPVGSARRARHLGGVLRVLILALGIVALAQPRTPDMKTRLPTEGIAILFVVDVSPSMMEKFDWDGETVSRYEAAKRAFTLFVRGGAGPNGLRFPGRSTENGTDAIGVVTFAMWPEPICPLTLDHGVLIDTLEHLRKRRFQDTSTNVGDAIAEGVIRLQQSPIRRKVMILLSDGEHNFFQELPDRDPPLRPRQAAQLAANLGIRIYAIDTGGEPPENDPDRAEQRLAGRTISRQVAEMTDGKFFTANDGKQLLEVYREIDHLERQPILSFVYRRYFEHYPWFVAGALVFLVLLIWLERVRWRRTP